MSYISDDTIAHRHLTRFVSQMRSIDKGIADKNFRSLLQGLLMRNMCKDIDNSNYDDSARLLAKRRVGEFYNGLKAFSWN